MVQYKCVMKKIDKQAPAKKERKTRSDKGGHHKTGESSAKKSAPAPKKVLPSQSVRRVAKKKKIKFNVSDKPVKHYKGNRVSKENEISGLLGITNKEANELTYGKKKKIKFNVLPAGTFEKRRLAKSALTKIKKNMATDAVRRARERNLGSGKQTSMDMLKRY